MMEKQEIMDVVETIKRKGMESPEFAVKLVEASDSTELDAILKTAGINTIPEVSQALFQDIRNNENGTELQEEELESVSGGFVLTGYALSLAIWAVCTGGAGAFLYGVYKGLKKK